MAIPGRNYDRNISYMKIRVAAIQISSEISTEILQGVPSIVLGIISYLWVVKNITNGFSAFAGSVALSIMMLPMIIRSTEETMKMIPNEIREAAFAMGTPYHKVIWRVLIPTGFSGLSTGILLSISRITWRDCSFDDDSFGQLSY